MTVTGLEATMADVDQQISGLEAGLAEGTLVLRPTVDEALRLANRLMLAFTQAAGRSLEEFREDSDPLEVFKVFVKGDPSLNAIRDNVRELVYYRNCLEAGREDALPVQPVAMAVRTIRHISLYMRTRLNKEQGHKGA